MTDDRSPYGDAYHGLSRREYPLKGWIRKKLATWKSPRAMSNLLDRLPHQAVVADIGCGSGELLTSLSKERPDLKLYGIDLYAVESTRYERILSPAQSIELPDNSIDLCICKHLIEHVEDPFPVLQEMARLLKPGGQLYLECPDVRSTSAWMRPNFWDDPTHRRPFTMTALTRLVTLSGLDPQRTGRVRDFRVVTLGPAYLPIALWNRDKFFMGAWLGQLFGVWIFITATKPSTS